MPWTQRALKEEADRAGRTQAGPPAPGRGEADRWDAGGQCCPSPPPEALDSARPGAE